jgi:uncharacterized protein (DUF697 family)
MIQKEMLNALRAEFTKSLENLNSSDRIPRLLILGRKEAKKENLVECLFGDEAEVEKEGNSTYLRYQYLEVTLYDLEESSNYKAILPPLLESVDVLWYCSTAPLLLKKEWDFQVLLTLQEHCPKALVVTSLKGWVFPTRLKKLKVKLEEYYQGPVFPAYFKVGKRSAGKEEEDWEGLLSWSVSVLQDSLQDDLLAATSTEIAVTLDAKKEYVMKKIIPAYTSGAGAVGALPIPFSDALLLIPEQVTMTVHILKIYGLEQSGRVITGFIGSTIVSQIGRLVAGSFIKLIPVGGSITGSVVNGSVATSFTWAIGMAISEMAYRYKKAVAAGLNASFEEFFKYKDFKSVMDTFWIE